MRQRRITDYLKLEGTHKDDHIQLPAPQKNYLMTKSIVQMLHELWQAWCCDHFPEEPVPGTTYPHSEETFPNVQFELPLI